MWPVRSRDGSEVDVARMRTMSRRRFRGLSEDEVLAALPFRVKVGRIRWLFGLVMILGAGAVMVYALFFDSTGTTPVGSIFKALMWVGLPLMVLCLPVYVMGALFPRHLTISEEGLSTWAWKVDWLQVEQVGYSGHADRHSAQASFRVSEELWESGLREANRWDSGRPFGAGGLTNPDPWVNTQANLVPSVREVASVFGQLHRQAWVRNGHTGGFDDFGPVVHGRRAVAPNVPAEDEAA